MLDPEIAETSFDADVAEFGPLFAKALDCLPDGVLVASPSRSIVFANRAFFRHWRVPHAMARAGDSPRMLEHAAAQLIDPSGFLAEVERLHTSNLSAQDEVLFRDGRIFSRRSVPFRDGRTGFQARIWIFTDVTEARNAELDTLTGLANRRAYSREFPAFTAAEDIGLVKTVALLDVDHFKAYNDRYGHAAGDTVLRKLSGVMKANITGDGDRIFRIGGEEFLIMVRTRSPVEARGVFENLLGEIKALAIPHALNGTSGVVTASIGLGSFRGRHEAAHVFDRVDEALYRSKSGGRDQVSVVAEMTDPVQGPGRLG